MKKLILSFSCLLFISAIYAQDASSYLKKAKKSFDKYQQSEETDKLEDALSNIKNAISLADKLEDKKATKVWMKAGEIYNEVALNDYKIFLVNNNHKPVHPDASLKAYEAFWNTVTKADKKWDKSKAFDELLKTATFISNEGIVAYNIESYEKAYQSFTTIIELKDFLTTHNHPSILNNKAEYQQHIFRTGLAAQKAKKHKEAIGHFEQLKKEKYKKAALYTGLYELYSDHGKKSEAIAILNEGLQHFPEDESLMIADINENLERTELDKLTPKLESAIKQNPNNISLYTTLGQVYNQLQKTEAEKGNFTMARTYFDQALRNFTAALDIDGTYAPALFNIGALYFNNASVITKEMKSLEGDISAVGIRKSNAKRSEMMALLDQSLPYFQKAEAVNPSDLETLSALMEIYTRKNDEVMANEFTARYDKVESGETIEAGYFDN